MSNKTVWINHEMFRLEGLFNRLDKEKAAVITHPHPLYGGDMHNNVVTAITEFYESLGFSTLRFNFRGVGKSGGHYDNGIGEQADLEAALQFVADQGSSEIDLIGYSFGSWVIYNYVSERQLDNPVIFVSPPVDFIPFEENKPVPSLAGILMGDRDEFASLESVTEGRKLWNPQAKLEVISGADHFYTGKIAELAVRLGEIRS